MSGLIKTKTSSLRALPSVDQLLRTERARSLSSTIGLQRVTALARRVTEEMRLDIRQSNQGHKSADEPSRDVLLNEALERLELACRQEAESGLHRVINATGVILHTNLGRAPLSVPARDAIMSEAAGYCTLEYDTARGSRGRRGARTEQLLKDLTGAEDALVVNNCAAASLLVLTVLAADGETVVSRGELVEIGGDFRIPDVMANSGTRMVEIGTTNRTSLEDYRQALTGETRLLMRVHPSNYRVIGFTSAPSISELSALANEVGVPLFFDAGSGVLKDLSDFGLGDEPVIEESISAGADVVTFSGDKLLGATQAGLIVGRADIIQRLRRSPLYRALRVDKLCLAALEATLLSYVRGSERLDIPILRMLTLSKEQLEERARAFVEKLKAKETSPLRAEIVPGESAIGGGSGPGVHPPTSLIALSHPSQSAENVEQQIRTSALRIIARIEDDKVLLDLRTVSLEEEDNLLSALSQPH
jgi:L-seryl-tRNA(Ser) seleniumtransferase